MIKAPGNAPILEPRGVDSPRIDAAFKSTLWRGFAL